MIRQGFTIVFAFLLAVSMFAPFAVAAPTGTQVASADDSLVQSQSQQTGIEQATIDPSLQKADGTTVVIVRLDSANVPMSASREVTINSLQDQARTTQRGVVEFAKRTDGAKLLNRFWIMNAVVLEVDTDTVDLESIAKIKHVDRLHPNYDLSLPEPATPEDGSDSGATDGAASQASYNTTYGLDQINATEVWSSYGTQGNGVKVAVLDTGVDITHPDLDLYTEDPSDPTYPGGWAEFDSQGDQVPGSQPHDTHYHGTHTSGTVAGGNASGEWIGVAPNVDLMHGLVIPAGGGSFAQVAGGIQWAANESADVASLSLGATGYYTEMIEPVRNAQAAGTVVVASSGNSYDGSSGSPGNVYESVAIGASNEAAGIADFSSGEEIDTSSAWGSAAPEDWPETYVVPDVAAPGVAVKSAEPGGGYQELDGTSMAAPHSAGAIALMLSASGDLPVSTIKSSLYETAWKPAGEPSGNDTRYGSGIIDVAAATDLVALDNGVNGTVTAADGSPIEGATVSTASGFSDETDAQGHYSLLAQEGTAEVTANAFGYESSTATVTVPNGSYATQNFSLGPALVAEVQSGQPGGVEAGDSFTVTTEVANAETLTVSMAGDYSTANATLSINGQNASFGEAFSFDGAYSGTVTVEVSTSEGETGDLSLSHTYEGVGDSVSVETGPTTVFDEYVTVGVVNDDSDFGQSVKNALDAQLPAQYDVSVISSQAAIDSPYQYDGYVVQNIDSANAEAFASATSTPQVGVVWLDQWSDYSNAIPQRSAAIGDPATTDEDGFGSEPVVYEVTQSHPIFDGVAQPGEAVNIHEGSYGDHTWFEDTDATVIAEVGDQGGLKGPGVAVDEDRNAVLASTLGRSPYVENSDFTDAADQILANSVVYATDVPEPVGELTVTDTWAQPGSSTTVTVESTAPGVAGYQATLNFDPSVVTVEEVNGQDFADPVVNINNSAGKLTFAQAAASGIDSPTIAEIELDVTGERGDVTNFTFGAGTQLNYENGSRMPIGYGWGSVKVASCTAGDVNMDGDVTAADATLVQRHIVGLPIDGPFNEACGDMNGDGQITSADVTEILQIIVGVDDDPTQPSIDLNPTIVRAGV